MTPVSTSCLKRRRSSLIFASGGSPPFSRERRPPPPAPRATWVSGPPAPRAPFEEAAALVAEVDVDLGAAVARGLLERDRRAGLGDVLGAALRGQPEPLDLVTGAVDGDRGSVHAGGLLVGGGGT